MSRMSSDKYIPTGEVSLLAMKVSDRNLISPLMQQ